MRVEVEVRVTRRMYVALRAVKQLGDFELQYKIRGFQMTRHPRLNFAVARLTHQQRQPADFELRAGANHKVGAARLCDQTRARLDVMRVL